MLSHKVNGDKILHTRRTNPGFLSDNEAARARRQTQDFVRSITGNIQHTKPVNSSQSSHPTITKQTRNPVSDGKFWGSSKGKIVQAIVFKRAYTRSAIIKCTLLKEGDFEQALRELSQAKLLEQKEGGKLWVTRQLYWRCKNFCHEPQEMALDVSQIAPNQKEVQKGKPSDNHITREHFLQEFFGFFGRDMGNPERHFTDNPSDLRPFIEECAKKRLPAFISVQPERNKAQPMGIEKVFFDFDYCKNSEILTEAETQKRKTALKEELKWFLTKLDSLNIKPLIIKTRRGYHIHIFCDSVYEINEKTDFWKQVYKQLQLQLLQDHDYKFIDYVVIGDINRMCRIPLSIHEKSRIECIVVDRQLAPDKIRSIEYFKLYGLKQKDILLAMEKARGIETFKQKQIRHIKRSALESSTGIRPCFTKAMNSGEMCHLQRLALLKEAYFLGFRSRESIIDLFRCFNDFNESITEYQVTWFLTNWAVKDETRAYSCRTIQRYGWCLGEECPRFKKN